MTNTGEVATQPQAQKIAPRKRDTLVIWFLNSDYDYIVGLDPHLQLLRLRLNKRFQLHFYRAGEPPLPPTPEDSQYVREQQEKAIKDYHATLENTIQILSKQTALFLPCISPKSMVNFWNSCEQKKQLQTIIAEPAFPIFPIATRSTTGLTLRPLATYPDGPEREAAYATLVAQIEATLLRHYPTPAEEPEAAPLLLLKAPAESERPPVVSHKKRFFSLRTRKEPIDLTIVL